ncbi:MAG: hypothetical protein HY814_07175 [Candidatus Riflebacteria bacterium]|nr:hypothetical protein [Candidatus Riflebacteria bacterium]
MTKKRLALWALPLLLVAATGLCAANSPDVSNEVVETWTGDSSSATDEEVPPGPYAGRHSPRQPKAASRASSGGRWRAAQVEERPETGAYHAYPASDGSRSKAGRSGQTADGRSTRTARASQGRLESRLGASSLEKQAGGKVRRVWSEDEGVRVKTVYDQSGNVVYRKGWDSKTGGEVPLKKSAATSRSAQDLDPAGNRTFTLEAPRTRGSRALDDNLPADPGVAHLGEDGPHHLVHRHEVVREGPTRFCLALPVWYNVLSGKLSGSGVGTATITKDNNLQTGFEWAIPHWFVGYQPLRHTTTATGSFSFRGSTFPVGASLRLDADIYETYTRWSLFDWHVLSLDWMLGTKVISPTFVATSGATTASYTTMFPVPYLGVIGQYELDRNMLFKGFVKYSSLEVDKAKETMMEGELALVYEWPSDFEFSKCNQVSLGYRLMTLDVVANGTTANRGQADVEFAGPMAKLTAYF